MERHSLSGITPEYSPAAGDREVRAPRPGKGGGVRTAPEIYAEVRHR